MNPTPQLPDGWHTTTPAGVPASNGGPTTTTGTQDAAEPTRPATPAPVAPSPTAGRPPAGLGPGHPTRISTGTDRPPAATPPEIAATVLPNTAPETSLSVPGWARACTTAAVVVVALVAAVVSYEHMREVGAAAGEGWRSWLLPLSVDGLIVAASMTMLVRRRRGQRAGWLAWSSLLLGIAASIAANVASADPGPIPRLVAAWSPLALLLAVELLMQQGRTPTRQPRQPRTEQQVSRVPVDQGEHQEGPR